MADPKEMVGQVTGVFRDMGMTQKIITGVAIVAVVGVLLSLTLTGGGTYNYDVLYSGLSMEDAADVVARLKEQRVPYQLSNAGTAIMVPSDKVHETRLVLAGEGLPRGGGVGFEIFDKVSLGTTDFVQRLNYQRALQGELARTIRQFQQIQEARVHIATPKKSVFIEDEQEPSASVSVKLRGREKLSKHQIQAIVNLVASAVPGLASENITVVDTAGRLLFRKQADQEGLLSASQLEYQMKIEETLRKKVETMLEEIVGVGKALARVTAEVDFNRINVTEENFDPEGQVIRSEQLLTEEDLRGGEKPQGIPGVKGKLATYTEAEEEGGLAGESHTRNNVTRNYEISRKTRSIQEATGTIQRLSVAVMVDGSYDKVVDKDGNTSLQYNARTSEEIKQFEKIAKNAIGFSEERGDQVEVAGMPFALSSVVEPELSAMDKYTPLIERLATPIFYLLGALIVIMFVVRPFFKMIAARGVAGRGAAEVLAGAPGLGVGREDEEVGFADTGISDKERIYKLAQSDPGRAADLVRRWLREER